MEKSYELFKKSGWKLQNVEEKMRLEKVTF